MDAAPDPAHRPLRARVLSSRPDAQTGLKSRISVEAFSLKNSIEVEIKLEGS